MIVTERLAMVRDAGTTKNGLDAAQLVRGVLVGGIIVSVAFLVAGVLSHLAHPAVPIRATSLAAYWRSLQQLQPRGLLFAGLAALAVTPLVGLLAAAVGFLLRKDRLFALVALAVLIITLSAFVFSRSS